MDSQISSDFGSLPLLVTRMIFGLTTMIAYLIFKRFEPNTILPLVVLLVVVPSCLAVLWSPTFSPIGAMIGASSLYYSALLVLVALYRLSPLHPLARYPGPVACRLTKWWMVWVASRGKQHLYYSKLHATYGDIVRIGPNELSVARRDAIDPVLGSDGLPKGPFWDRYEGMTAPLIAERDPAEHARRRKPWTRAFNGTSMKNYEVIVHKLSADLLEAMEDRAGTVVDVSAWMGYYGFDVMGEMAFGAAFGFMKAGSDVNGIWKMLDSGLEAAYLIAHVPWAGSVLRRLPGLGGADRNSRALGSESVSRRIAAGSSRRDLFYHLIDEDEKEPVKPPRNVVVSDGLLAIIAGSDTTASALTLVWYFLMSNPACYHRLVAEVVANFADEEAVTDTYRMANMVYLNACINEALRLYPPSLGGSPRSSPVGSQGKVVGPHFVPEGTQITIHTYTLHRDPRHFSPLPDSFWPDRWLAAESRVFPAGTGAEKDTFVHNAGAFIPFSFGPTACVGRPLAIMELRSVVCTVLKRLDVEVAPGFELGSWEGTLRDYFAMKRGALPVVFRLRKGGLKAKEI